MEMKQSRETETTLSLNDLPCDVLRCVTAELASQGDAYLYFKRRLTLSLVSRHQRQFFMTDLAPDSEALMALFSRIAVADSCGQPRRHRRTEHTPVMFGQYWRAITVAGLRADYYAMLMSCKDFLAVHRKVATYCKATEWRAVQSKMPGADAAYVETELIFVREHFGLLLNHEKLGCVMDLHAYLDFTVQVRDVNMSVALGSHAFDTLFLYEEPADYDDDRMVAHNEEWYDVEGFSSLYTNRCLTRFDKLYHLYYAHSNHMEKEGNYGERENIVKHWSARVQERNRLYQRLMHWHQRVRDISGQEPGEKAVTVGDVIDTPRCVRCHAAGAQLKEPRLDAYFCTPRCRNSFYGSSPTLSEKKWSIGLD